MSGSRYKKVRTWWNTTRRMSSSFQRSPIMPKSISNYISVRVTQRLGINSRSCWNPNMLLWKRYRMTVHFWIINKIVLDPGFAVVSALLDAIDPAETQLAPTLVRLFHLNANILGLTGFLLEKEVNLTSRYKTEYFFSNIFSCRRRICVIQRQQCCH